MTHPFSAPASPEPFSAAQPAARTHPIQTWGLLTLWLAYSAVALGWHLANDPLLSSYVFCGVK
jgi:hypothetical protein